MCIWYTMGVPVPGTKPNKLKICSVFLFQHKPVLTIEDNYLQTIKLTLLRFLSAEERIPYVKNLHHTGRVRPEIRTATDLFHQGGLPSPVEDYQHDTLDFNRDFIKCLEASFYGSVDGLTSNSNRITTTIKHLK